jgi:NADPH2:quinone reductase
VRSVVCRAYGPPEQLVVETAPDPTPGPGRVVVAVEAAGLSFVDALFVMGTYQIRIPPPFVPGTECAGTVVAVGEGVSAPAVGARVLVNGAIGTFTTHLVVAASACVPLPAGIDMPVAATFAQSYCTMQFAYTHRSPLAAGETVLVLGAGGGVGLAAIDLARQAGCRVIAAASSDAKLAAATAMGADATINTATEDLKTRAKELSGGGVDVVVDPIGGALADAALRAVGWWGRYLVIGFAAGGIPALPANLVLLNNRTVVGVDWGAWRARDPRADRAMLEGLLVLAAHGRLHPVTPACRPLDEAPAVLRDALDRRVVGKVALVP